MKTSTFLIQGKSKAMQNRCLPVVPKRLMSIYAASGECMMTDSDGNVYDTGTITFSGEPAKRIDHQTNIYQVEDVTGTFSALRE